MSTNRKLGLTAKDKRLLRKERQKQVSVAWESIRKANDVKDPLSKFAAFSKFKCKDDSFIAISSQWVTDLDDITKEQIFNLERNNMQLLYEECDWGWHEKKKRNEMFDDRARYLIARNSEGNLVAFSHYRFDIDFDIEVLYCYELQLTKEVRRQGLGKFLLQILELIAFSNSMKKVILTSLTGNEDARKFFEAMNYELDETSPYEDAFETYGYVIMSKKNKKLYEKVGDPPLI